MRLLCQFKTLLAEPRSAHVTAALYSVELWLCKPPLQATASHLQRSCTHAYQVAVHRQLTGKQSTARLGRPTAAQACHFASSAADRTSPCLPTYAHVPQHYSRSRQLLQPYQLMDSSVRHQYAESALCQAPLKLLAAAAAAARCCCCCPWSALMLTQPSSSLRRICVCVCGGGRMEQQLAASCL
jgi:hypothetical protein